MKLVLNITLENAAFDLAPGIEVARILRDVASALEGETELAGMRANLFDLNGNRCGKYQIED